MTVRLPSSGQIKMSQIREEFLDDTTNNTLNEYGGGESGLTPQNKGAGTQRKFSDYYSREYKIVKELTNPDVQLPSNGTRHYYDLRSLFTTEEAFAPNDKVINIRDPGTPIGYTASGQLNENEFGVLRLYLSGFSTTGAIELNNYAKIYAPGGIEQRYGNSFDQFAKDGGNAVTIEAPATGYTDYNVTINNYSELRGGGGAGAPGGKGGNGQYSNNGVLTESIGGNGGSGGKGRGYQSTSPYYTTITGSAGSAGGTNAGTGGPGGSGGDWAQAGNSGNAGATGTIGGTQNIGGIVMSYSVGAGGIGGLGGGAGANGTDGGASTVTVGNTTFTAPGGRAGDGNFRGTATNNYPSTTSSGTPQYQTSVTQFWNSGEGSNRNFSSGGALGAQTSGSSNGAMANVDNGPSYSRFLGTILNTVINYNGGAPEYESSELLGSGYGRYYGYNSNGIGVDGGSPARWGGGGGAASGGGGNGGNGMLGGGGGGATATPTSAYALWWQGTRPGYRTLTDALSRSGALYISVKIRQGYPWGNSFESHEGIDVEYSLNNGSTWTSMAYISTEIGTSQWHVAKYKVPLAARGSGVRFRINQRPWTTNIDQWAAGPAQIHYQNGTVDVLWTPGSIPGTFWYATGIQDTDYVLSRTAPGYSGSLDTFYSKGGDGGSGFVLFGFVSGTSGSYVLKTSGSGTVTVPANTDKVFCWVVGGGGGGGGAGTSSYSTNYSGGGGASGTINYFEIDNVSGSLGVNTTGSSGSSAYGQPGKAVAFQNGRKPTFTMNNLGVISGSYT